MGSMEAKGTAPEITKAEKQIPAPGKKGSHKRRIIIFAVVSLLNVGLLVFLWTQLLTPAQKTTQGQSNNVDPLIGHSAPNFSLAALGNHSSLATISPASYKGQQVVLNFWTSTCGPCIDEAPLLQKQWQSVQSKGIVFIGIDFQDTAKDGGNFLQKYGITYANVLDATGSIAISYGVTGVPETIFINRQGVVVSRVIGELTGQTLQSNLQLISR